MKIVLLVAEDDILEHCFIHAHELRNLRVHLRALVVDRAFPPLRVGRCNARLELLRRQLEARLLFLLVRHLEAAHGDNRLALQVSELHSNLRFDLRESSGIVIIVR